MWRAQNVSSHGRLALRLGRAAAWYIVGAVIGFVMMPVGLGAAMVGSAFALFGLGIVLPGVVLSFMPWPALAGAITILLLSESVDFHISMWVPSILGATWAVCRGVRALHQGLRKAV